jgi:hypothetical protein
MSIERPGRGSTTVPSCSRPGVEEEVMNHPNHPADPEATDPASPQELVRHLRGYEGRLPEAVRRPLIAAGATIVPALIALVEDALADAQPDLGWAPLHAVDLLGALGDARAVPVLLRCLDLEDELNLRVEQAEAALRVLGTRALEDCVAAYAASPRDAFRDRLAGVMSQWGLRDERLYTILLDMLQRTPGARRQLSRRLRVWQRNVQFSRWD